MGSKLVLRVKKTPLWRRVILCLLAMITAAAIWGVFFGSHLLRPGYWASGWNLKFFAIYLVYLFCFMFAATYVARKTMVYVVIVLSLVMSVIIFDIAFETIFLWECLGNDWCKKNIFKYYFNQNDYLYLVTMAITNGSYLMTFCAVIILRLSLKVNDKLISRIAVQ